MFREELERVVGDSLREGGADGISALLSDVMNIKSGSKIFYFHIFGLYIFFKTLFLFS